MREVVEIVVRLGETTLEHRFESLDTPVEGVEPAQLGPEWTHVKRGLADISARLTNAPRTHALGAAVGDRRSLGYVAGSLAVHLLLWGVATDAPPEITMRVELERPSVARRALEEVAPRAPAWEVGDSPDYDLDGGGQPTMGLEGKAGGDRMKEPGHARLAKGPTPAVTTKQEAIEQARTAGILGSTVAIASRIGHLTRTADFNAGFDDLDVQGPLYGGIGEGRGNFGLGRHGLGDSAGCGANCDGLIGVGRYGTISNGRGVGDHWGGHAPGAASVPRQPSYPRVRLCAGPSPCVVAGGLDKAVIRRYIQRQLPKIQYCYEKELLVSSALRGVVDIHFLIQPDGHVSTLDASGVSPAVSSCIGDVIKSIEFPSQREGISDVHYPITLHEAGS